MNSLENGLKKLGWSYNNIGRSILRKKLNNHDIKVLHVQRKYFRIEFVCQKSPLSDILEGVTQL